MASKKYKAGYRKKTSGTGVIEADIKKKRRRDTVEYHLDGTITYTSSSQANINAVNADSGFIPEK